MCWIEFLQPARKLQRGAKESLRRRGGGRTKSLLECMRQTRPMVDGLGWQSVRSLREEQRRHAAIHNDLCPSDEASLLTAEKCNHLRDVTRRSKSSERMKLQKLRPGAHGIGA